MGKGTKIGWANNTFNWAYGCDETSNPGCKECYAIHRLHKPANGLSPAFHQNTDHSPLG